MISFKLLNDEEMFKLTDGSSFKGHVYTTYSTLLKVFGYPQIDEESDADKTLCEWVIHVEETGEFGKRLIPSEEGLATIYCYRTLSIPRGKHYWNIGGHNKKVVGMVKRLVAEEESKENPFRELDILLEKGL